MALLLKVMAKRPRVDKKKVDRDEENVCTYCLFFQQNPTGLRAREGNCTYHKEWIENASRTTCSDMSSRRLKEKGIYLLALDGAGGWLYRRREQKLRTHLFLLRGGGGGARTLQRQRS